MSEPPTTIPASFVFLDAQRDPFLVHDGWLHWWHPNKEWVTQRELRPGEDQLFALRRLPDEQAALYGYPFGPN